MSNATIWRYLSLAKYVDLLSTQHLWFPKASSFADTTEGKWIQHVLLREQSQNDDRLRDSARQLKELLARAGDDPTAILREANALLNLRYGKYRNVLDDVLIQVRSVYPHKRREHLESYLTSWQKILDKHIAERKNWISDAEIYQESTYVSCWNRLDSMSIAMWELYSKGQEGVAVRSTMSKLRAVIDYNSSYLDEHKFTGEVIAVKYLDELKAPSEKTQDKVKDALITASDTSLALFSIKPDIFEFEHEVRASIYPKRSVFDPIANPYPDRLGFALAVGKLSAESEPSVTHFIDAVYLHPTLGCDSIMFKTVSEIHKRFQVEKIEIVANRLAPFED